MAAAGFCSVCGQYVWLDENWACVNGHPASAISHWYDPQAGVALTPPAEPQPAAAQPSPAQQPAAPTPADDRLALLGDILAAFARYPGYTANYGTDADIVIGNHIADASWGTGKKRVDYDAVLKAVPAEKTVYFWELLKEQGAGLSFGGMEAETTSISGMRRSGKKKEIVLGPGGTAIDYEWDYAATRLIVEDVVSRHGWRLKTVLRKKSAQW
jgi:hypothetical protein